MLDIEKYDRPRLKVVEKVPQYPPNMKPPKMQKRLRLMRGPELIHNTLLHKQYGIIATGGGRMRHGFFEMIRLSMCCPNFFFFFLRVVYIITFQCNGIFV